MTPPRFVMLHEKVEPHTDEQPMNKPVGEVRVPVSVDPGLGTLGECGIQYDGSRVIRLREWDEQVLLHEVLHAIIDRVLPADPNGDSLGLGRYHHLLVREIEVGLTVAGWRPLAAPEAAP